MWLIDKLAEGYISEAIERGELSGLPGEGKPLNLDDDALVPEELRAGYRLLKNAGYLPPELALQREIREVEQLLSQIDNPETRLAVSKRLSFLMTKASVARGEKRNQLLEREYSEKMTKQMRRRS